MKKLAIINTEYTLLFYILNDSHWRDTQFFFIGRRISTRILQLFHKEGGQFFSGYRLTLPTNGMIESQQIFLRLWRRCLSTIARAFFYFTFLREKKNKWIIYGHEMLYPSTFFLKRGWNYYVLEDGTGSYASLEQVKKWYKDGIFGGNCKYLPNGWSDAVKGVILSGQLPIPEGLREKTQFVDLHERWDSLPAAEKETIFRVFGFDIAYWQRVFAEGRDCFLLTGNHYAYPGCSKEMQIEIYREILSHYDRRRVIINRHPADQINYREFFPDCMILEADFPMELFYLTGLPIKKVISIYSSAGLSKFLRDEQVDFHVKYLERFGTHLAPDALAYISKRIYRE